MINRNILKAWRRPCLIILVCESPFPKTSYGRIRTLWKPEKHDQPFIPKKTNKSRIALVSINNALPSSSRDILLVFNATSMKTYEPLKVLSVTLCVEPVWHFLYKAGAGLGGGGSPLTRSPNWSLLAHLWHSAAVKCPCFWMKEGCGEWGKMVLMWKDELFSVVPKRTSPTASHTQALKYLSMIGWPTRLRPPLFSNPWQCGECGIGAQRNSILSSTTMIDIA